MKKVTNNNALLGIKFKVENNDDAMFPESLFNGLKENINVIEHLNKHSMIFTSPQTTVQRKLSDEEIAGIRSEYSDIIENKEPVLVRELEDAVEEQKRIVSEAKENLGSARTQVRDCVYQIKRGSVDFDVKSESVYRFAANDHYGYYVYQDNALVLAKVTSIPDYEKDELFNIQDANQLALDQISLED